MAGLFNRGDSQCRTRSGKPGTPPQQMPTCPCGNRQISGCPHDCQRSSILSFKPWERSSDHSKIEPLPPASGYVHWQASSEPQPEWPTSPSNLPTAQSCVLQIEEFSG